MTYEEKLKLAVLARPGDQWRQIKSGRIATVVAGIDSYGCLRLKHENNRVTSKWKSYFCREFEPVTEQGK